MNNAIDKTPRIRNLLMSALLMAGLAITPVSAMADKDKGHKRGHGDSPAYVHNKHGKAGGYDGKYDKSHKPRKVHFNEHGKHSYTQYKHGHKYGHAIKQSHKRGHRNSHKHGHKHHAYGTHYHGDYGHSHHVYHRLYDKHHYHDPRISVGVHLGHFDLLFQD